MNWSDQVFRYCERGAEPGFWAEPVNAITNLAFVAAALAAMASLRARPDDTEKRTEAVLVAVVFLIGVGSFLFHTFATRLAALADVLPIGIFMIVYLSYALRRFAGCSWGAVAAALAVFIAALWWAGTITCRPSFMPVSNALNIACLNGTVGYVPALIALFIVAGVLRAGGHPAAPSLLLAGVIFSVSKVFRTLDFELCDSTAIRHVHPIGTHFLWHMCNGALLFVLLRAAILYGSPRRAG